MQSASSAQGRFVWFELMALDVPAAIAFYGKVIGWTVESWGADSPDAYQMWKTPGGQTIGGVMKLPDQARAMGAPPHWLGNLVVESTDAALEIVKAAEGMLFHGPMDVPNVGRVAVVSDPMGATFAVYQPLGDAPGHSERPRHGEISWCELMTADPEKAWNFYQSLVGWKSAGTMEMGEAGTYQMFGPTAESAIGGMMRKPAEMPVSAWTYYIYVDNLDTVIATAVELRATVMAGPMPIPGGDRVAILCDPQGAVFAVHGH